MYISYKLPSVRLLSSDAFDELRLHEISADTCTLDLMKSRYPCRGRTGIALSHSGKLKRGC